MILVLNEKDHINSVFPKLNVVRMKNTAFCEKAELVGEVRPCAYDLGTINFNKKKNIRQKAYLQSWKYFQNVEQEEVVLVHSQLQGSVHSGSLLQ
jgi:hypothetical protein